MSLDLDAIRARATAATPGPWGWFGNTDVKDVFLATHRWGRQFVMRFRRWGTSQAQPEFAARTWKTNPQGMLDFECVGGMTSAVDIPVYEVAPSATSRKDPRVYRADLAGIRNPDAEFIAHARQDIDDLLAEVDRLRAELAQRGQAPTGDDVRYLVWSHKQNAWWGPGGRGYRQDDRLAGRFTRTEAIECCSRRTWDHPSRPPEVMVEAPECWDQGRVVDADQGPGILRALIDLATREAVADRAAGGAS